MSEPPTLLLGDCFEVLQTLEAESVDACVTDPPYGLSFMGKHWDRGVPATDVWEQVYRVLKPGAHLLSFFGTRTYHRGVVAIEDAGFEIRDQIGWLYGSGFPKSRDVSKDIDRRAGAVRPRDKPINPRQGMNEMLVKHGGQAKHWLADAAAKGDRVAYVSNDTPITDAAKQWDGWGTALKPAWEPIVVARKPLIGTVAQNVLEHGTGGINIDASRIATDAELGRNNNARTSGTSYVVQREASRVDNSGGLGRWPANVIHDDSDEVLAEFAKYGERYGGGHTSKSGASAIWGNDNPIVPRVGHDDTGTAARFFYTAKASKDDRNDGLHDWEHTEAADMVDRKPDSDGMNSPRAGAGRTSGAKNQHPTVKPTSLMRYLVRLVCPKGGLVLDPFAGSGTTLIAAYREGCRAVGIELDPDYHRMASHRIDKATAQLRLEL